LSSGRLAVAFYSQDIMKRCIGWSSAGKSGDEKRRIEARGVVNFILKSIQRMKTGKDTSLFIRGEEEMMASDVIWYFETLKSLHIEGRCLSIPFLVKTANSQNRIVEFTV
jgi:hypothetical protein